VSLKGTKTAVERMPMISKKRFNKVEVLFYQKRTESHLSGFKFIIGRQA
jgi:hypothetical protein